jgi:hypothetical protein
MSRCLAAQPGIIECMKKPLLRIVLAAAAAGTFATHATEDWQSVFSVDRKTLGVQGANPYLRLTPGYRLTYKKGSDTDTITVLAETRKIDGVETRVVEDREMKNGKLVEVTRDYYAVDSRTNDVYYFGEDVDAYRNGKIVNHQGSWLSGVNGARFGLMMPAAPRKGQRFYQEHAPGTGMDRTEILAVDEKVTTPAGTFDHCVHVVETSPIEQGLHDHKWYAPGVGQVRDGSMPLVEYRDK